MTAKKTATKSKEVKPPVQPIGHMHDCRMRVTKEGLEIDGEIRPVLPVGVMTFTTRKYPDCESAQCKHPAGGMKAERADKRDRFCQGCGDELKVVIYSREDHCRECGRAQADFFLVCPNERWWHFAGRHFTREFLGSGRMFDDTSDEAKKADAAARAKV